MPRQTFSSPLRSGRRRSLAATVGLTSAAALLALAGPAAAAPAGSGFSCRGSAARVTTALGVSTEPIRANAPGTPCRVDSNQILAPTTIGPLSVDAATAATSQKPATLSSAPLADGDGAGAMGGVTNPKIALPGLAVSASVLDASAGYTCRAGQPVASSSSMVANLTVNGMTIKLPANDAAFTLDLGPLGSLSLNQTTTTPGTITRRALFLHTPVTDVVIGEAVAGLTGNPCAAAAAPPPAKNGTAGLTTSPSSVARTVARFGTGRCVQDRFNAVVVGHLIREVAFSLDGRGIGTDRTAPFEATVHARPGIHTLRAHVTFTDATSARGLSLRFRACAAKARHHPRHRRSPRFTG